MQSRPLQLLLLQFSLPLLNLSGDMSPAVLSTPATIFPFPLKTCRKMTPERTSKHSPSVLSVLTHPTSITTNEHHDLNLKTDTRNNNIIATATKTVYHDNWFDQMAINYLSKAVQEMFGMRNEKSGYDGIVTVSGAVFREFNPNQQRKLVIKALEKAIPRLTLFMIRTLLPESKFKREFFAAFTTVFFRWLIGPSEVRVSEIGGRKERNVVYIKKCRFLEEANCVGMCTNLCKMPTQEFINNNFGTPVNMVPNFEDMSCEMIFGQDPPAEEYDPAFKQPCYKLCNAKQKHSASCIS